MAAHHLFKPHKTPTPNPTPNTHPQKVFIRDCTVVSGMALLLFGGQLAVLHEAGQLLVGGWLRVKAAAQVGGRTGAGGVLGV
jgi:hypothetical protein